MNHYTDEDSSKIIRSSQDDTVRIEESVYLFGTVKPTREYIPKP